MIPAVAQALAKILAAETSLSSLEQIDFNPPNSNLAEKSTLTVYCYDIQECPVDAIHLTHTSMNSTVLSPWTSTAPRWFELKFLISAWDCTILGEQQLLSEALAALMGHPLLQLDVHFPVASANATVSLRIAYAPVCDPLKLWSSFSLPIRPALYVSVEIPIFARASPLLTGNPSFLVQI